MSNLPINDWQFWAASAVALAALYFLVRPLIPGRKHTTVCPKCPDGAKGGSASKKASLTIDGAPPKRTAKR